MKLCRCGDPGKELPALVDETGTLRSLQSIVNDLSPENQVPGRPAELAALDPESLPGVAPG